MWQEDDYLHSLNQNSNNHSNSNNNTTGPNILSVWCGAGAPHIPLNFVWELLLNCFELSNDHFSRTLGELEKGPWSLGSSCIFPLGVAWELTDEVQKRAFLQPILFHLQHSPEALLPFPLTSPSYCQLWWGVASRWDTIPWVSVPTQCSLSG